MALCADDLGKRSGFATSEALIQRPVGRGGGATAEGDGAQGERKAPSWGPHGRLPAKNAADLNYGVYRAGLPIATGVIEGACRYLVKDRMDITGAQWSLLGGESTLRVRALIVSGHWESYWEFHLQKEHERNYPAVKEAA